MPQTPDGDDELPEMFSAFVSRYAAGQLDMELAAQLREFGEACSLIRKKGSITLTFTVHPEDDVLMPIAAKVDLKLPRATPPKLPQFRHPDGSFSDQHPSKKQLPFPEHTKDT